MSTETQTLEMTRRSSGELSAAASAALAKATIEAKFTIAMHRRRNEMDARSKLLDACKRKGFAEGARFKMPRWNSKLGRNVDIEGFSIRFAEAAVRAWGNVDVSACVAYEDDDKRMVRITVTDLESNISYTDEVVLNKTIERAKLREGQEAIGERTNSEGKNVFIIAATEDELLQKVNSAKSKSIRTSGLRLVPEDILDEAWDACAATLRGADSDPAAALKTICDSFNGIGVGPAELESYLGHSLKTVSPSELSSLRKIFAAIRDGEAAWNDYVERKSKQTGFAAPAQPPASAESDEIPGVEPKPAKATPEAAPVPKQSSDAERYQRAIAKLLKSANFTEGHLMNVLREQGVVEETLTTLAEVATVKPSVLKAVHDKWGTFLEAMKDAAAKQ